MSDWDTPTVIGRNVRTGGGGPRQQVAKTNGQLNAALRNGSVIASEKRYTTGNKTSDPNGQRLTKIDRENEVAPPKKIDASVGKIISAKRAEKGLTQKDLATKINEKPQVINEYESGRAVPNQQLLAKMERVLGVKLRGKDIGSALGGPKKK